MFKVKPGQFSYEKLPFSIALVFILLTCLCLSGATAAETRVRILHLAPEAGKIEVWVEGELIDEDLEFREDTGYLELSPGETRIVCKTTSDQGSVILNSLFPFRKEKDYTITLSGYQASDLQLMTSIDSCPPSERLAQLKFTYAVSGSPPTDLSIKYGPTLYENLSFRTSGGCRTIPPGNYILKFTESRTGQTLAERDVTLEEGKRYNFFATGRSQGEDLELINFEEANKPEREPRILGVERSVLQLLGAGLIASVLILVLGQG